MNSSELAEVVDILIDNAIESLREYSDGRDDFDPWIDISLSIVNDKLRIEVKDNGPGIKKEHQSLLFKDGFTTKGPGHGFGLSYSVRYIQRYGGNLSYESHPGFGACFVIELLRAYHNER
jgi:signal transduction histidine kinase